MWSAYGESRRRLLAVALGLVAAGACAAGEPPAGSEGPAPRPCTEPRPDVCTHEYRPACGHRCDAPPCPEGQRRTYPNACAACSDAEVTAVTPGPCEGAPAREPTVLP